MTLTNPDTHTMKKSTRPSSPLRAACLAVLIAIPLALTGCKNVAGFVGHVVGGEEKDKVYEVEAKYKTLAGHSVAIVVKADQTLYFQYPAAPGTIQRSIAAELALQMPSVRLTDPAQIEKFQKENPYWNTMPDGDLLKRLKVERLILVDIAEFSLHEPGNASVWRGTIRGNVSVHEDNSANANNSTFSENVDSLFPNDSKVGVLNSDDQTMLFGLSKRFSQAVVGLFYDHKMKGKS